MVGRPRSAATGLPFRRVGYRSIVQVTTGIPHAKPFPIWIGFVLCFWVFVVESVDVATNHRHSVWFWTADVASVIYFFMCVYRFHQILSDVTFGAYPIEPGEAVCYHLIPLFNLYWLFSWPSRFADYVNAARAIKVVPGMVIGSLLIASGLVAKFVDASIGLACCFGVMAYMTNRLGHFADYRDLDVAANQITPSS
jgi:hypothetical protein